LEALVARPPSGDHPVNSTNGAIGAVSETTLSPTGALDRDQTLEERDQTLADVDQTASDSDQTAADSDQTASDSDQAASDRDLASGGDRGEHELTRDLRDRNAEQRQQVAQGRVDTAAARDTVADSRDLTAAARDQAAAVRDRELSERDATRAHEGRTVAGLLHRAVETRKDALLDRAAALESRTRAAADREQAAHDREQAARDRLQAQLDRDALLQQLAIAETDQLTGTRMRAAGLADLEREIERARRTTTLLAVAYVDVVGLKAVNDLNGHSGGDALLQRAVRAMRGHLRSYDLIVRHGGDEFVCVMSGATIELARQRFDAIQAALASEADPSAIKVGFAELAPEDSALELIERADADLPATQRQ
jgi:diguanylate cyclase (GGDEF)-like protein